MLKVTEQASLYDDLEQKTIHDLLTEINGEDCKVALAVSEALPQVEGFVTALVQRMQEGGRLFYIGAGTSGRLGVLDASEIPPTFGVPSERVIGLIAGGDGALRRSVEKAEDDSEAGWCDLLPFSPTPMDSLVGIAASGTTPYVVGALTTARCQGLLTAAITSNPDSLLSLTAQFAIEIVVGPEYVTGSSRMKSGTAQKMVLNMISTAVMIRLGRVRGNRMVNMQLSNDKLVDRGTRMVAETLGIGYEEARHRLLAEGSVAAAICKGQGKGVSVFLSGEDK
ncbi:MAG: N-acetylmuramic acid 6-phosphate etherase [Tannerellaceae bacterium]|jgi:N-acetylmuramic acid 6-phosphate etherase|nr:N-acetylmuramic acid 6-phosphate etherase [Tannerellaceae bacterium]